jgi:predicted dehydrogenase/threonine dehydrogenase-like Zn-dependent dehydrogenase
MKQLFKNKTGIKEHEVPLPNLGDKELLITVETSVISTGTETMSMKNGDKNLLKKIHEIKRLLDKVMQKLRENGVEATIESIKRKLNPAEQSIVFNPIGYSNAGIIIAKGRLVNGFNVGDRVACAGSGIAAHAEYVTIPVNLAVKLPDNVPFNAAAFTTIGSIAMQGIRRAEVTCGETVVITGLGLLGLIAVQIAKAWGLVVIGLDLNPKRLEIAKRLGADQCYLANDFDSEKTIQGLTNGNGADAVIIYAATKSSDPANQALRICRRKGRVVVVGAIGMELQREAMYLKELDFVMSTSYGPGRYDNLYEEKGIDYPIGYVRWTENRNMMEFVRLISAGQIDVLPLISNSFTIDQVTEAYKSLVENPGQNISSIFKYQHEAKVIPVSKTEVYPRPIPSGKIKVGIIGAGGFVQNNHIPNILKLPEQYELVAIANRTTSEAKSAGEKYKVRYITTDYHQILNDPGIDLVVIGTRHNLHAIQVVDTIKAGKHVLVEKPLALTVQELESVNTAFSRNPEIHATVGFNRRYSPLTQKVREIILKKKECPIIVNYRINAGAVPIESWIQDREEGGGRILGEVCHFIDLVGYLTNSSVVGLGVTHIPLSTTIKAEDNLIILLKYANGSLGSITYTAIGGKSMEKERVEIFQNGSSMVIEDFIFLKMYNTGHHDILLKAVDKGHYMEIYELAKLIKGQASLIMPFMFDINSSELTLKILNEINRV